MDNIFIYNLTEYRVKYAKEIFNKSENLFEEDKHYYKQLTRNYIDPLLCLVVDNYIRYLQVCGVKKEYLTQIKTEKEKLLTKGYAIKITSQQEEQQKQDLVNFINLLNIAFRSLN